MTQESEMQNAMRPASHWESKVVCITGVSPWALAKKVNDAYAGRFVVGTQVFRDGEQWVALVYYKVKASERAEVPAYGFPRRIP